MLFLKRKTSTERRRLRDRRRGVRRRKTENELRLRNGFRAAFLGSYKLRRAKDRIPMTKTEWLDSLILGAAAEASRYIYRDKNDREIPWRLALEKTSELAWDLHEPRMIRDPSMHDANRCAERMIESTVDYLLARCRVMPRDRRVNGERRAA